MRRSMVWRQGIVVRGHRVASGEGGDPDFPHGTIRPQLGAFRAAIPDFEAYLGGLPFAGTINVQIEGAAALTAGEPDFRIGPVRWTDRFQAEIFLLSRAILKIGDTAHPAFLYIPDPATKPRHFQPTNVVELLATHLPALKYGDPVTFGCLPSVLLA